MMFVDDRMVQKDDGLKEQYVDSSIFFVKRRFGGGIWVKCRIFCLNLFASMATTKIDRI